MIENASQIQSRLERVATEVFQRLTREKIDTLQGYDPLVFMMLGASASEFEKLRHEMADSREQILEKLAAILCPDVLTGPLPAYSVLHAPSQAGIATIHRQSEFKTASDSSKEHYFSPAGTFEVSEVSIRYLVAGKAIQKIHPNLDREFISQNTRGSRLTDSFSFWIGLEVPEKADFPDSFSIFLDSTDTRYQELIAAMMTSLTMSHEDRSISLSPGLPDQEKTAATSQHIPRIIEQDIRNALSRHFLQIDSHQIHPQVLDIPQEIRKQFRQQEWEQIEEPCVWLRADVVLPGTIQGVNDVDFLDQISMATNCIPVINRVLTKRQFKLSGEINLFPLPTSPGTYFNEIEEVQSSSAKTQYQEKPYYVFMEEDQNLEDVHAYSLRRDGVSRFDERSANELLSRVSQKIREEGRVFSAVGKTGVSKNVQNLQRELHQLHVRLKSLKNHDGALTDVFIGFPPARRERVVVRYWATEGFEGNFIPKQTPVAAMDMIELNPEGLRLMRLSEGGRSPLNDAERLHVFRSALAGRTQIRTIEQIRNVIEAEAGPYLQNLTIREDIHTGGGQHTGLERVLAVTLFPSESSLGQTFRWGSWENFAADLEERLEKESSLLLPIRVKIQQEAVS